MSDPTQAEDLLARIKTWRESDRAGYDSAIELICDAEDELSRLSRVEQALRELALKWRDQSKPYLGGAGDEAEWAACRTRCADELYAALSASPEAQPEEGR